MYIHIHIGDQSVIWSGTAAGAAEWAQIVLGNIRNRWSKRRWFHVCVIRVTHSYAWTTCSIREMSHVLWFSMSIFIYYTCCIIIPMRHITHSFVYCVLRPGEHLQLPSERRWLYPPTIFLTCVKWLSHICAWLAHILAWLTQLTPRCHITHSYVLRNSITRVTWLTYVCITWLTLCLYHMTHPCLFHMTHLMSVSHDSPLSVSHDSPMSVSHDSPMSVSHDSPMSVSHDSPMSVSHDSPMSVSNDSPMSVSHCVFPHGAVEERWGAGVEYHFQEI